MQSESIVFDVLERSEEAEEEDRPSEKVEDAIEDHLVGHRNNVATL